MSPAAEQHNLLQSLLLMVGGVAATLGLLVSTGSLGLFGGLLIVFVPVPVAYLHLRYGTAIGLGSFTLVLIGSLLLSGPAAGIEYLLQFGLLSLLLPLMLQRKVSWAKSVAVTVAVVSLCTFLALAFYAGSAGLSMGDQVGQLAKDQLDQAMALSTPADVTAEQLELQKENAARMVDYITYAYPGMIVTFSGFLALLLLWMLCAFGRGHFALPGVEFQQWKASELLVWPLIAAGFAAAFADGTLGQAGVNLLIVLLPVYFLQGTAIVTHFFNRRKTPPFLRGLGYLMIAVLNPLPLIITGIGVFDLWIDFRKPRVKTT